ncbi:hypothetical protein C0993_005149, partial [Termitomyces sp. T159_Od127]
IDLRIDGLLEESNKDMNVLTKTRRYRVMVKEARDTYKACLQLASRVQKASLSAQIKERQKPANMRAKAEEEATANMERKIRYNKAKREYQKLCELGRRQRGVTIFTYKDAF